jgi:hypothetical protein
MRGASGVACHPSVVIPRLGLGIHEFVTVALHSSAKSAG